MKAIAIPKQNWISAITLDFIKDGWWKGHPALHLALTGAECPDQDVMISILEILIKSKGLLPRTGQIIRLSGRTNLLDPLMELFAQSLRDYDFSAQIVLGDGPVPSWAGGMWKIMRLSRQMVPTVVNEIWYSPKLAEGATEIPDLTALPPSKGILCYIDRQFSVPATLDFMAKSPYHWILL